jgi:hypothetical protein
MITKNIMVIKTTKWMKGKNYVKIIKFPVDKSHCIEKFKCDSMNFITTDNKQIYGFIDEPMEMVDNSKFFYI